MERYGDWAKAIEIVKRMGPRFRAATQKAMLKEGHYLRGKIIQGITSGAPAGKPYAPLSAMTLIIRKFTGRGSGSKPMIASGAFRQSIGVHKIPGGGILVGVLRSALAKNGKSLANLGEIHEFGATWRHVMSAKQRRFFFAAIKSAGGNGVLHGPKLPGGGHYSGATSGPAAVTVTIPARPTFGPVFEKFAKPEDVKKRFWASVAHDMGGDFGAPG